MIENFEVGKYYKWIGPNDFDYNFNDDMEHWKDGKKRKCLGFSGNVAEFENINGKWYYVHCMCYFEKINNNKQLLLFEDD